MPSCRLPPAGFSQMLTSLSACYALTIETLPKLDDASLAPLDVLVLCTTEGPALPLDARRARRDAPLRAGSRTAAR